MVKLNNKGITLIELLATISITFIIMGLVSGVLIQSFKSMETSETHINLRQEANIILSMLSGAHLSSGDPTYNITFQRISNTEWEMSIGEQQIINSDYDIKLELRSSAGTSSFIIDTTNTSIGAQTLTVLKKQPLNVYKLNLTNKKDRTKKFEISTIISRL